MRSWSFPAAAAAEFCLQGAASPVATSMPQSLIPALISAALNWSVCPIA
jgi:hypothetical protein